MTTIQKNDFEFSFLDDQSQLIAKTIIECLKQEVNEPSGGGCRAFYDTSEWAQRGERYGIESVLIVCHDGGDLAPYFSLDLRQYDHYNKMERALNAIGFYQEQCTTWYSAIYPK